MKMIRCLLGDIITFQRGYDLPRIKMEPGEYPVVGSNGIIGYHNQYTTEAPCITIGRSGNVGGPQIQFGRAWAHNTTLFVKEFKNVDPVFVYYLLLMLDLGNYAGGSAVPTLNRNHIHSLPITIPAEIESQKRIAGILSSFDDKIEVNNQINRNLEEQAKAIFKSWFVDFEPFQDGEFVDSELGRIPKGWRIERFDSIASVATGKRPAKKAEKQSNDCSFPIIGASSVMGYTNVFLYNCPILVTGRVGTHGIVQYFEDKCWPSDNTLVIQSNLLAYAYYFLNSIDFHALNRGTTQPLITQNDIKKMPCLIAANDVMYSFENRLSSIRKFIQQNKKENIAISRLRDTLLPKLMSGEMNLS